MIDIHNGKQSYIVYCSLISQPHIINASFGNDANVIAMRCASTEIANTYFDSHPNFNVF